jgi:hypothetical protein
MGALFGKLPDMGKSFEADLTRVDPADANFYVIIRGSSGMRVTKS